MKSPLLWAAAASALLLSGGVATGAEDAPVVADVEDEADLDEDLLDEDLDGELPRDEARETSTTPAALSAHAPLELTQPLSFVSPDPAGRVGVRVGLGPPGYANALALYEHGFDRRLSAFGEGGFSQGSGVLRGGGRYALVASRFRSAYLSVGGTAGLILGSAVYPELRLQLGAGKRFADHLDLQAVGSVALLLGGSNPDFGPGFLADMEYHVSAQAAWALRKGAVILESDTRLEPTRLATDPPTSAPQVFSTLIVGGRYNLRDDLSLGAGVGIPLVHQFRWDYYWSAQLGATWLM